MKRYPVYKNSGVEWLGEIPEHWEVKRLKFLAKIKTGEKDTIDKVENGKYPFFVRSQTVERLNTYSYDEEAVLTAGDGVGVGKVFHYINGKFEYHQRVYKISEFKEILGKYFFYYIKNNLYAEVIKISAKSTVDSLRLPMFLNFPVSIPPLEEQKAIAHFLDHKLEQIEQYIRNKKRLIELLNEQKTAIINRAVTKGINPNVPMKHSGIEWLGEIPAHWQLVKLGNLCWKVADGPHFSPSYLDEGIMFLSARNVKVDSWSLEDIKYISQKDYKEFCKRIIPETGDILYTKGGTTGIARVVDLEEPFQVWVHIAVLKLKKEKINPYLLAYILNGNACYQQSQLYTRGATNQDLGLTRMVNIVFAIPPSLEEQQYIVDYLKNEISKIALAIAQIEKEIELIQEYRTTLISDAVTGKIDVRGFDNGSNSKNSPKPPELATM